MREGPTAYAHTFQYHPSGGAEHFTAGNGLVHRMSFDGRHRVSGVRDGTGTPASVLDLTYSYDRVGNVTGLGHSQPAFGQQTLVVDHMDRLTLASGTLGGTFGYSAVGNMTSKDGVTFTYDGGTNRLSSTSGSPGTRYCYDLNGNIKSTGPASGSCPLSETVYTYSPSNMLERATVGSVATTYRYDGDQLRVRKVQGTGPTVSHYIHGPGGQLLSEFSSPCFGEVSLPVRDYVYVNGRLLATVRPWGAPPRDGRFLDRRECDRRGGRGRHRERQPDRHAKFLSCERRLRHGQRNRRGGIGLYGHVGDSQLPVRCHAASDQRPSDQRHARRGRRDVLRNAIERGRGPSGIAPACRDNRGRGPSSHHGHAVCGRSGRGTSGSRISAEVTLSAASGKTVSVTYATDDDSATAGIGVDVAATGALTFLPGQTSQALNIGVVGDLSDEPSQTFIINLTSPVNATLPDAQAVGTILDNDPPPTISIDDLAILEHNDRSPRMRFTFTFCTAGDFPVSVNYATSDITATAGIDYTPSSGTVTFAPGTSAGMKMIGDLNPDFQPEPNETFQVDLSDPVNSSIGDGLAIGTILDDEETDFFTLTPCRFVDTRGGAALTADSTRLFPAAGGTCGIPAGAKALAVSLTVVNPTAPGNLIFFPAHSERPLSTSITFNAGALRSNNAIAVLGGGGQLGVYTGMASGSTHLIIDVFGYFE